MLSCLKDRKTNSLNKWAMTLSQNTESHASMSTCVKEKETTGVALEKCQTRWERGWVGNKSAHTLDRCESKDWANSSCHWCGEEPWHKNLLKGRTLNCGLYQNGSMWKTASQIYSKQHWHGWHVAACGCVRGVGRNRAMNEWMNSGRPDKFPLG